MDGVYEDDLLDPHPDIHALFCWYNECYFDGTLSAVSVEWSSGRMTLCGGTTTLEPGGGVRIKLSGPLLKYRPARDLKMVLLHEMIHAHGFVHGWWRADGDHGPQFRAYAARINASAAPDHQRPAAGYRITCTHDWMAEVNAFRTHHWKCSKCGDLVRRAMNRPPQPADCVTTRGRGPLPCGDARCAHCAHLRACGGAYDKVAEPEGYASKGGKGKGGGGRSSSARGSSSSGGGGGGGGVGGGGSSASGGGGGPGGPSSSKGSGGGGAATGGGGGNSAGPSGGKGPLPPAKRPKNAPRPPAPPPRGADGSKITDWLLKAAQQGSSGGGGGGGSGGDEASPVPAAAAAQPADPSPAVPPALKGEPPLSAKDGSSSGGGGGGDGGENNTAPPPTLAELRQRCLDAALRRSGQPQPQQQARAEAMAQHTQQQQQQQQEQPKRQQLDVEADVIVISDDE